MSVKCASFTDILSVNRTALVFMDVPDVFFLERQTDTTSIAD